LNTNNNNQFVLENSPLIINNSDTDSPSNKIFSMKILTFGKNCNFPNGYLEEQSDEDDFDKDVDMKKIIEPKNNKNLLENSKSDNFKQIKRKL